jgi:hypothetical protein
LKAIIDAVRVDPRAWIAVVAPHASEVVTPIDTDDREPILGEAVRMIYTALSGPDDDRVSFFHV